MFTFYHKFVILLSAVFCISANGIAQSPISDDPRDIGLDLYVSISRESPPDAIAYRISELINIYRYRCTRVSDYQVYRQRPNLLDLKVKCSGSPLYGLTIGSNGYVAVYGGNGIVSGLDRRDALIYSFSADGGLHSDGTLTIDEALEQSAARINLGDQYNPTYLALMVLTAVGLSILGLMIWVKVWRNRNMAVAANKKTANLPSRSSFKDHMLEESTEVAEWVSYHPSGIFIAVGKRGKRRLFSAKIWAQCYATFGWHLFEASEEMVRGLIEKYESK